MIFLITHFFARRSKRPRLRSATGIEAFYGGGGNCGCAPIPSPSIKRKLKDTEQPVPWRKVEVSFYKIWFLVRKRIYILIFLNSKIPNLEHMSESPKKYRLDRTAFQARNASEQVNYGKEHQKLTWQERLRIHQYLNSIAYGYDLDNPPRMDKTYFQIKKRE